MYKDIIKEKFDYLKEHYTEMDINILAIESSCDETSIAVVQNGRTVLSNVISSQIDIHKRFGGVVPEVASRNHVMAIDSVLSEALEKAQMTLQDIHAIAVTYGAGLVGALMVGVNYAKALSFALELPLIKVNHIKGHLSANYIAFPELAPPFIGLVVSGGHTAILKVNDYVHNELIGTTVDDAIGESYDKVAKVLGLGYPGGPIVDRIAQDGQNNIKFISQDAMKNSFNVSYSGLKTAVINYLHKKKQAGEEFNIYDVCASFQCQAVEMIVEKTIKACLKHKMHTICLAGGVAANSYLRYYMEKRGNEEKIFVKYPPIILCTDNAAMIGCEAFGLIVNGENLADLSLSADCTINLKYANKK